MLILGLLGMYFDAAVVFTLKSSLLFKLVMAILWIELTPRVFYIIMTPYSTNKKLVDNLFL